MIINRFLLWLFLYIELSVLLINWGFKPRIEFNSNSKIYIRILHVKLWGQKNLYGKIL